LVFTRSSSWIMEERLTLCLMSSNLWYVRLAAMIVPTHSIYMHVRWRKMLKVRGTPRHDHMQSTMSWFLPCTKIFPPVRHFVTGRQGVTSSKSSRAFYVIIYGQAHACLICVLDGLHFRLSGISEMASPPHPPTVV
jgi:hypothetical protein